MSKTDSNHLKVPASPPMLAKFLRPLRWNELVRPGDFVEAGRNSFEPWVGPSGFRADAFIKKIYRRMPRPRMVRK
jgi:hypothetical protein